MRDPKRIDKFCEMFKSYWHMVPDWRFMQLVCNLQAHTGRHPETNERLSWRYATKKEYENWKNI